MNRKKIIISVISDLATDQRVQKVATTLQREIGDVTVVCTASALVLPPYPFSTVRLKLWFRRGFLFYAEFNIRLFFVLLVRKANVLLANDVDTILPNHYAARIKGLTLVFDSHEIMSEVPEVVNRPVVQRVWKWIEKRYIPKADFRYTVCDALMNHYNVGFSVIRNVPYRTTPPERAVSVGSKKVILYQGSINMGRGIETVLNALPLMNDVVFRIIGTGYALLEIKALAASLKVEDKVQFMGRMLPEALKTVTPQADLGISLEENLGLNYYYALPNKLLDYIQACVPVVVSDFPEMGTLVKRYNIGEVVQDKTPKTVAAQLTAMLNDEGKNKLWKTNLTRAAEELCWEKESSKLITIFKIAVSKKRN